MFSRHIVVCETERLTIRTATIGDLDLYYALWTDPKVMTNVGFPQGLRITRDELKDRLSQQGASAFGRLLVIALKATEEAIGEGCMHAPNEDGIAEPDVKLLPAFWGHRYGTEAWRALVAYLFEHTNCDIVQGTPNVENVASIKMQEAAGALKVGEGVFQFPESMRSYTKPVHHYVYQVHRMDWQPHRREGQHQAAQSV